MKRTAALLSLAITLMSVSGSAQLRILLYDDTGVSSGFGLPYYEDFKDAINNLGHAHSLASSESQFNSLLTAPPMGEWDMIVCDVGNFPNALSTLDRIKVFLDSGRPVIYGHWQAANYASHPIFAQEGVTVGGAIPGSPPTQVVDWGAGVWSSPNACPTLSGGSGGMYGLYGQNSNWTTGTPAGGYATVATPNQAGVILGVSGRFIFNAFIFDPYSQRDGDSDGKKDIVELAENEISYLLGASCSIQAPVAMSVVSDDVVIEFSTFEPMAMPVTAFFEFSTDGGTTFSPATAAPGSPHANPSGTIITPSSGEMFFWDSVADGVGFLAPTITTFRVGVNAGTSSGSCPVVLEVDNVIPLPVCFVTGPAVTGTGDIDMDLILLSINSVDVNFWCDFSTDSGATWSTATAAPTSLHPNPATGVTVGRTNFLWDSRADNVGLAAPVAGVLFRTTIDDLVAPLTSECTTLPFEVDNTLLCGGICGDCNLGGTGPDVIDALTAAQIAVGLVSPTTEQSACCDINSDTIVDVIDALGIAQFSAGLAAILMCL